MSIAFVLHGFFFFVLLVGLIVSSVYPVPLSVLTQFQ